MRRLPGRFAVIPEHLKTVRAILIFDVVLDLVVIIDGVVVGGGCFVGIGRRVEVVDVLFIFPPRTSAISSVEEIVILKGLGDLRLGEILRRWRLPLVGLSAFGVEGGVAFE